MSADSGRSAGGPSAMTRAAIAIAVFVALVLLVLWLDPDNLYFWVRAVHVIAVIPWMA